MDVVAGGGATDVTVAQIEGEIPALSCADGGLPENIATLNSVAVANAVTAGVTKVEIVSVSTAATCEITGQRRSRRQAATPFTFATEIILQQSVADSAVATLTTAAAGNTLDYSAAAFIDSTGDVVAAATVTTTAGQSVTIPVAKLSDPSTDLANLISCPTECLAHDHDGDGGLDHPVVFKGKKSKGKKGAAAATLIDCSTCPTDTSAFAGKGKKAKKAKGAKKAKSVKKAGKGKKGKLSAALHSVGGTVGAGVLSGAVVFAAAIVAAMYSSKVSCATAAATPADEWQTPGPAPPRCARLAWAGAYARGRVAVPAGAL